jgi:hypothetical protein
MIGQCTGTTPAAHHVPAIPARNKSSLAPSIDKQNYLLAPFQRFSHGRPQGAAENAAVAAFKFTPHIDYVNLGQGRLAERCNPLRQLDELKFGSRCAVVCLNIGCGAAHNEHGMGQARQLNSNLTRMITRRFLGLLVSPFMFLVHNYQAQVWLRSEYGAARSYYYVEITAGNTAPLIMQFPSRERAVQNSNPARKPGEETIDHLGRQGYLRHQADALFPHFDRLGQGLEVYLCLTASRHTMQ